MIDLKAARQEPDRYRAALARRGAAADFDALLAADIRWRELTERSESLRAEQKRSSKAGPPGPDQLAELRRLADELTKAQAELAQADHERQALLDRIPNLPDPTAADGMAEEDAQMLRTWGDRPSFGFTPRDATDLGAPRAGSTWRGAPGCPGPGSPTGSATLPWPSWRCTGSSWTSWPATGSCRYCRR